MPTSFVTGGSGFVGRNLIRALRERGFAVRALARSEGAAEAVRAQGAEAVAGDLSDRAAMASGMRGCERVFHAAAKADEWGAPEEFERINVGGTENALAAAREAGCRRFVHVSTEAVFADGGPLASLDERKPRPERILPRYPRTKARAEAVVEAANGDGLETVIVRPRMIWGAGDTSLLPKMIEAVRAGRFQWIDGGRYPTTTTHVRNVCEGLLAAAERGRPGESYFVTDGEPVELRAFLTRLLATQGVEIPDRSVPRWVAWPLAVACDAVWSTLRLSKPPPVSRLVICLFGSPVTIDDSKARRELGYRGAFGREEGLAELAAARGG